MLAILLRRKGLAATSAPAIATNRPVERMTYESMDVKPMKSGVKITPPPTPARTAKIPIRVQTIRSTTKNVMGLIPITDSPYGAACSVPTLKTIMAPINRRNPQYLKIILCLEKKPRNVQPPWLTR